MFVLTQRSLAWCCNDQWHRQSEAEKQLTEEDVANLLDSVEGP